MNDLACFTSLSRLLLVACCWRADNNPIVFIRACNHCHRACHVLSVGATVEKSADLKSVLSVKKEISLWVRVFWNVHIPHLSSGSLSRSTSRTAASALSLKKLHKDSYIAARKMCQSCARRKWPDAWVQPAVCRESRVMCVAPVWGDDIGVSQSSWWCS